MLRLPLFILFIVMISPLRAAVVMEASAEPPASGGFFYGKITSAELPVKGAMVTFYHGEPVHSLSVFADEKGQFISPRLPWPEYKIRVRRAGWRDVVLENQKPVPGGSWTAIQMERISDSVEMIQQLPSNYWMDLVLEEMEGNRDHLLEFKMQCTYCHQQGSPITSRRQFTREQWIDIIHHMGQLSAILTKDLRTKLPDYYLKAYDPKNVMAKLPKYDDVSNDGNGPLPIPDALARRAVIEEWDLGGPTSSQHDMMVYHPDGSIWSVDGPLDTLHSIRFDKNPDGDRKSYLIPRGNHKPGGVYHKMNDDPNGDYLGAHSLQTAPNGDIWLTLASGNQLAGFNPKTEKWDMVDLQQGINPHTLRFDKKGRIWYTITATNHVGMYNPTTREHQYIRLTSPGIFTELLLRITPFLIKHADLFDLKEQSAKADGVTMPMPYGIDIHPVDGSVWYSQLNMSHIGRIDPETLEVTPVKTPFITPRRLRFDSKGGLWVPSYAEGTIHLFDTKTLQWKKSWVIPVTPMGSEVPYAVFIDQKNDDVWITGTQSDSIIRFVPSTEQWTHYPLPTRVTYTRELDMDKNGGVWTSHSSFPAWHVESGIPKVTRLLPHAAPDIEASGLFEEMQIISPSIRKVELK
jgi:virginiamycin B lyase